MNRLQQAMLINAKFDHYYATEEKPSEIGQFNVIYDALLEIDELINVAESEQLDEEVTYELTPAGEALLDEYDEASADYMSDQYDTAQPGEFSADMSEEFSDFSPSVGTFEGTAELAAIVGKNLQYAKRAPVWERVYSAVGNAFPPANYVKPKGVTKMIGEVFAPCEAH